MFGNFACIEGVAWQVLRDRNLVVGCFPLRTSFVRRASGVLSSQHSENRNKKANERERMNNRGWRLERCFEQTKKKGMLVQHLFLSANEMGLVWGRQKERGKRLGNLPQIAGNLRPLVFAGGRAWFMFISFLMWIFFPIRSRNATNKGQSKKQKKPKTSSERFKKKSNEADGDGNRRGFREVLGRKKTTLRTKGKEV